MRPDLDVDDNAALARLRAEAAAEPAPNVPAIEQLEREAATLTGPALADLAERLLRAHAWCMARLDAQAREAVRARLEERRA